MSAYEGSKMQENDEARKQGYLGHIKTPAPTAGKQITLPTDAETEQWFTDNIDGDSASSAIYKFRLWLKDRNK